MLDEPPTPGTGDVDGWKDGELEGLLEQTLAAEPEEHLSEEPPATIAASGDHKEADGVQEHTAQKTPRKIKPHHKTVADSFFKAPNRKPQEHTRTKSNASAQPFIFSKPTTGKLAKVPTKGQFPKPVPKFNPMTNVPGVGTDYPAIKMADISPAETAALKRQAAEHAKAAADLKAKNKEVEDRRVSVGVQAKAKAEFERMAADAAEEVLDTETKKPEHYHPDGQKLAMAMENRKAPIASTVKPDQKGVARPMKQDKLDEEQKAKIQLKQSALRSETLKKNKKKKEDVLLEREESKRVAGIAMEKNKAAMPEHYQQGEKDRKARQRQLSDVLLTEGAAKTKRKRPETESSAPSKKTKTSKLQVHKVLSSPHVDEQEDEDDTSAEMEGVTVERKVLAHKKTKHLDNQLKLGSNSLEKKRLTSAAPQKHHASENSASTAGTPPSKKRRAEEPDAQPSKDVAKKKRKVEKVVHTVCQHVQAWGMIRDAYKKRGEPVPMFVPHVEGVPSLYVLRVDKKGISIPAEPVKEKAKPRASSSKFSLNDVLAEQDSYANDEEHAKREARKIAKEEERMDVRERLHAPGRYQGSAARMKNSAEAQAAAANVDRLNKEKTDRGQYHRETRYSAKDIKEDVKEQERLDKQWKRKNGNDSQQSKHTQHTQQSQREPAPANDGEKSRESPAPLKTLDLEDFKRRYEYQGLSEETRLAPNQLRKLQQIREERVWALENPELVRQNDQLLSKENNPDGLIPIHGVEEAIERGYLERVRGYGKKKGELFWDEEMGKDMEKREMTRKERGEIEKQWKRERTWEGLEKGDKELIKGEVERERDFRKRRDIDEETRKREQEEVKKRKEMTRGEREEFAKEWKEEKSWERGVGKQRRWRVKGWVKDEE